MEYLVGLVSEDTEEPNSYIHSRRTSSYIALLDAAASTG
jgi:hypothetical protein